MTFCDGWIYLPLASATGAPQIFPRSPRLARAREVQCSNWQIAVTACDRIGVL